MSRLRRVIQEVAKGTAERLLDGIGEHLPENQYFTDDATANAYFTDDLQNNNYVTTDF